MKNPLISVITVSKNSSRFIEDNILSVKCQDYPAIEHVVIDGASTDSTVNILRKYKNLRWISEPDTGVTDAFNKGLGMVSGDIISFLNADDVYHNRDSIYRAVAAMEKMPDAGVIFGDCSFIDSEDKIIGFFEGSRKPFTFEALLCSEYTIPMASAFIRRSAVKAIGDKLDTSLDFAPDWELWVRIGLRFPIMYVPEIFGSVREYTAATQRSLRCATENPAKRRLVLAAVFSDPKLPLEIRALEQRAYSGTYMIEAFMLLNIDYREMARKCIWRAARLYPRNIFRSPMLEYMFRSMGGGKLIDKASELKRRILKQESCPGKNEAIRWWV